MKGFKTRVVEPGEDRAFWARSDDCWQLALQAASDSKWAGCAINIIHSMIALADLVCIQEVGKRYAGTSHDEAIDFYASLDSKDTDFKKSVHRLGRILSIKTQAEYDGAALTESQVREMLKSAERFRSYVLSRLGK